MTVHAEADATFAESVPPSEPRRDSSVPRDAACTQGLAAMACM